MFAGFKLDLLLLICYNCLMSLLYFLMRILLFYLLFRMLITGILLFIKLFTDGKKRTNTRTDINRGNYRGFGKHGFNNNEIIDAEFEELE